MPPSEQSLNDAAIVLTPTSAVVAQLHALRHGLAVLPLNCSAIEVRGKDRVRFLHSMLTQDVQSLIPGQGAYGLLLTVQGKVVADMYVFLFPDHILLVQDKRLTADTLTTLDRFLIADKATLHDAQGTCSWIHLAGPLALSQAEGLLNCDLNLPLYAHQSAFIGEIPVHVFITDPLQAPGLDLCVAPVHVEPLLALLAAHGAVFVDEPTFDVATLEAGIPLVGVDITTANLPAEAGAWFEQRAIHFNKGCYIGQEVICRVKARGHVNWQFTAFTMTRAESPGTRLFDGEKDVGYLTRCALSPRLGWIGLGYVHKKARLAGQTLRTGLDAAAALVTQHALPLVLDPHPARSS